MTGFEMAREAFNNKDYQRAFPQLYKLAQGGDPEMMHLLGMCYYGGLGTPVNFGLAYDWFMRSAGCNYAPACRQLGMMYRHGRGVAVNHGMERDWFARALQAGDVDARFQIMIANEFMENNLIGTFSLDDLVTVGDCCNADGLYQFAVKYYMYAATRGNAAAMNQLANCYRLGEGVPMNNKTAFDWYKKGAAAGCGASYFNIACAYRFGRYVNVDYAKAIENYRRADEMGVDSAECIAYTTGLMNRTVNLYVPDYMNADAMADGYVNEYNNEHYEMAAQYAIRLSNMGVTEAYEALGHLYYTGTGVPVNLEAARLWYERAASANVGGFLRLGNMSEFGTGTAVNGALASDYYLRGAQNGDTDCMNALDNIRYWDNLYRTRGIVFKVDEPKDSEAILSEGRNAWSRKDYETAFLKYKEAAELGNVTALNLLGNCYNDGKGTQKDWVKGFECKREAAAQGEKFACYGMGTHYMLGRGVNRDYNEALKWFEKARDLGHASAGRYVYIVKQLMDPTLEFALSDKEYLEIAKECDETNMHQFAVKYYLKAACMGNAEAMNLLGNKFYEGIGTCQNDERALYWYQRAAECGNKYAFYNVGKMYEYGRGVEQNYGIALQYYNKAKAAGNNVDGYIDNALRCQNGDDGVRSFAGLSENDIIAGYNSASESKRSRLAAAYAKALADFNNVSAFNILGNLYLEGKGVPHDTEAAYEWYQKAAARNYKYAFYNLGKMYETGIGVSADMELAVNYYRRAAELGHESAADCLVNAEYWADLWRRERSVFGIMGDNAVILTEVNAPAQNPSVQDSGFSDNAPGQDNMYGAPSNTDSAIVYRADDRPDELPESLDSYFEGIIGMDSVRKQLDKIYNSVKLKLKRDAILRSRGEEPADSDQTYNFVLLGNPGTGKTMIARIIAKILYDIRIRETDTLVETDRSQLVEDHIGGTEKLVRERMDEAMGGTLFIDEAYALYRENSENDFGKEAIDNLIKGMEDRRNSLSVIIAGYKEPMMNMLKNANSGFSSRFTYIIEIPDYTDEELITIARSLMEKQKYKEGDKVDIAIKKCIAHDKIDETFGNARYIRELVKKAIENQASRIQELSEYTEDELFTLEAVDFWQGELEEQGVDFYLAQLYALTGLESVKKEVESLINRIQVQKEMEKRGMNHSMDFGTLHMAFKGNPGTGKTTVARIIGNLYSALGVLKRKDVFVECSRATLVAPYVGQTAPAVIKTVQSALGGILFVDEAYSLCQGKDDSFGKEAVDALVAEIENHRDHLVAIFAGYSDDIDEFFRNNQGLKSRVPIELVFEDYSQPQLYEIALSMIKSKGFVLSDDAESALKMQILAKSMGEDFGNARGVRNIVDGLIKKQNVRMATLLSENPAAVTNDMLVTITAEDII